MTFFGKITINKFEFLYLVGMRNSGIILDEKSTSHLIDKEFIYALQIATSLFPYLSFEGRLENYRELYDLSRWTLSELLEWRAELEIAYKSLRNTRDILGNEIRLDYFNKLDRFSCELEANIIREEKLMDDRLFKKNRALIYKRDNGKCRYCGKKLKNTKSGFHIDHIIPKINGGKSTTDNLALSCPECNIKKHGRTPEQAGMPLIEAKA